MKQLLDSLEFRYEVAHSARTLHVFADGKEVVGAFEMSERTDILDQLADIAIGVLKGQYSDRISFNDEDEGYDIGLIKAGRVLQIQYSGPGQEVCYILPRQFVDAVVQLLETDTSGHASPRKLAELKELLAKINKNVYSDDDPEFKLSLECIEGFEYDHDRLKIQWGDMYFFADSGYTNIPKVLLDAAIALLQGKQEASVLIEDRNNDFMHEEPDNKSEFYRPFTIDLYRNHQNSEYIDVTIGEEPWGDETILIAINEYIAAVDNMVSNILEQYSEKEFNQRHAGYYDRKLAFPAISYNKFKLLRESKAQNQ